MKKIKRGMLIFVIPLLLQLPSAKGANADTSTAGLAMPAGSAAATIPDKDTRMKWWREARFGLFIHYNLFSLWMDDDYKNLEAHRNEYSAAEYDRRRAEKLKPVKEDVENWVLTAKSAGMKYIVLTTKHNCGFPLWNSKVCDFNAFRLGPKRDIVDEFVKACRTNGIRVGFYFALNDNQCPARPSAMAKTLQGRNDVIKYIRGLLRELMTEYGQVDILWYDEPWPLGYGGEWDSAEMNRQIHAMQPNIIINDRSLTSQDFTCSEGKIKNTDFPDQDWEACMTFNGTWSWFPKDASEYCTPHRILEMLWQVTTEGGNLLLNVGPNPYNGWISEIERERLAIVGKWLNIYGEAVYGKNDRIEALGESKNSVNGKWTKHGNNAYLWVWNWTGESKITISSIHTRLKDCEILAGPKLKFEQTSNSITITGLPAKCPDDICGVGILKLSFEDYPR